MEISKALYFYYIPVMHRNAIYRSNDLSRITGLDDAARHYIGVYGVVDTEAGNRLFSVEANYSGEPILMPTMMGTFLHEDSFLGFNNNCEIVNLDE